MTSFIDTLLSGRNCPGCGGEGSRQIARVQPSDGTGCRIDHVTLECRVCDGHGRATPQDWDRWHRGRALYHDRMARRVTLFDEARTRGIDLMELHRLEKGERPKA